MSAGRGWAYEAGRPERAVIIEFATVDAARAAHDSAAYQEATVALSDGAVRGLRIVPGVAHRTSLDRP